MKIDTLRHTGDRDGIRVSAWIEASEIAAVQSMKEMVKEVLTILTWRIAGEYFEQHKAELLAAIDIKAITEQVEHDLAAHLTARIVAAFPAAPTPLDVAPPGPPSCHRCGHVAHEPGWCLNMASDGECECRG